MVNRRVFISINLDEKTKKYISEKLIPLREKLNANWTKPEQFHITLSFLGFVEDEIISQICHDLRDALEQRETFDLYFEALKIFPSLDKPKMLWLKGEKSEALLKLRGLVEETLTKSVSKKKGFEITPHITLARLKSKQDFSIKEIDSIINKSQIKASIPVLSIDVMESINEKGIWKNYFLEQIELQ